MSFPLWPTRMGDFLYTFCIFSGGYVCHFNILSAHRELILPTQARVRLALHLTMAGCLTIYAIFATAGLGYTGTQACDNILLNFCHTDLPMAVGRAGFMLVLVANLPLIILPCRQSLQGLLEAYSPGQGHYIRLGDGDSPRGASPAGIALQTIFILGSSLALASVVPGVHLVWTILGGTVAMLVAYIFPALIYLKLRAHCQWNVRKTGAVALALLGAATLVTSLFETAGRWSSSASCPAGYDPCMAP